MTATAQSTCEETVDKTNDPEIYEECLQYLPYNKAIPLSSIYDFIVEMKIDLYE